MSNEHSPKISPESVKAQFLTKLVEVQNWLQQEGIPYRIIGSLALNAYTGYPINFVRESRQGYQTLPDIDLIVPREQLSRVEGYRKTLLTGELPIHLELLSSYAHIDFRPNEEYSYLTHQKLKTPIKTDLWHPVVREIDGVSITTVPPQTLFHTYVTFGGNLRHTDWPKALALSRYITSSHAPFPQSEEDYQPVHQFLKDRREKYPHDLRVMWIATTQAPKLPGFLYKQLWDKSIPLIQWYYRLHRGGRRITK